MYLGAPHLAYVFPGTLSARSFGTLIVDLDFGNASSITLNGSTISQINGSSGTTYNFSQATAVNQPTYTAADANFNGKGSATFSGNQLLASTSNITIPTTAMTLAYVVRRSNAGGTHIFLESSAIITANSGAFAEIFSSDPNWRALMTGGTASLTQKNATGWTANSTRKYIVTRDWNVPGASDPTTIYENGTAVGSYSATANTATTPGTFTWYLGARSGVGNPFQGSCARILAYQGAMSAGTVTSLYNWLTGLYG